MTRSLVAALALLGVLGVPGALAAAEPLPPAPPKPPPAAPPPSAVAPPAAPVPTPPSVTPPPAAPAPAAPGVAPAPPVAERQPPLIAPDPAPPEATAPEAAPPPPPDAVVAAPPAPPAPPKPAGALPTGPPARPLHHIFFQGALGGGALIGSNGMGSDTRTFSGASLSWHALVGGTLGRGWALGAGYAREHVPSPSAHDEVTDGDEPNLDAVTFSLDSLTVFADWHPREQGFHALLQLGLASFVADRGTGFQVANDATLDFILGAGWDHRLDNGLTLGALGQLTYARPEITEGQTVVSLNLLFPAILLTAGYQ